LPGEKVDGEDSERACKRQTCTCLGTGSSIALHHKKGGFGRVEVLDRALDCGDRRRRLEEKILSINGNPQDRATKLVYGVGASSSILK